jgi:CO/xanthine dehydrogenase FAD-binding subunit
LEAEVELRSVAGTRRLPLSAFITGYRKTALQPGELVTGVVVPRSLAEGRSAFVKLGSRRFLVISIVSAAALLVPDAAGKISAARIAVGACSAVPLRIPALESALAGRAFDRTLVDVLAPEHLAVLTPIDDVRGGAVYRRDAAAQLIREALLACVDGQAGGMA